MKSSETRESIIIKRGYRQNIEGDKFILYISNHLVIADYLKKRLSDNNKVLVELCCEVGITMERLINWFKHIIWVDIDQGILNQCTNNLKNTWVLEKTTLVLGDINDDKILKNIKADIAIYDIPFWFPHQWENQWDLTNKNPNLTSLIAKIRASITKDIVIFAPPSFEYSVAYDELGTCEFQKIYINEKHDRTHIYLGELINKDGVTEIKFDLNEQ